MKTTQPTNGFTLIELLVVIGIIAMLMSILMPALNAVKKYGQRTVCQSNLVQWGLFFSSYAEDNDDRFFAGYYQYNDGSQDYHNEPADLWQEAMKGYYDDPKILLCPSARYEWGGKDAPFTGSYGLNGWVCDPPEPVQEIMGHSTANNWRTMNVGGGRRIPLFLDSQADIGWPESSDLPSSTEGGYTETYSDMGRYLDELQQPEEADTNHMRRFAINCHRGRVNMLAMDTSVTQVGLKELWRLKWHRNYDTEATLPEWPEWMIGLKNPE